MEKKTIFVLVLAAFLLLAGFVVSIEVTKPASEYFPEVAKQQENDFAIFKQSDNILSPLKNFDSLEQGALLVQNTADGLYYIVQESQGNRQFEVYAYVTKEIVEENSTLKGSQGYIYEKMYPFVWLDCYNGIGTDYTVPETVWNSNGDLKLDEILGACKTSDGSDLDYTTSGLTETAISVYDFSSFLSQLRVTRTVGYPFSGVVTPVESCASITDCMVKFDKRLLEIFK